MEESQDKPIIEDRVKHLETIIKGAIELLNKVDLPTEDESKQKVDLSAKDENKRKRKNGDISLWIVIASATALTLSFISVCAAFYRTPELGFDYQGVIVAVLGILITLLIGWQILNVFSIEKKINEIVSERVKDLEAVISKKANDLELLSEKSKLEAIGLALAQIGASMQDGRMYSQSLTVLITAVGAFSEVSNEEHNNIIDICLNRIITSIENIIKSGNSTIPMSDIDYMILHLENVRNDKKYDVIEFLRSLNS